MKKLYILQHLDNALILNSISIILIIISLSIIFIVYHLQHKFKKMNDNLYYREELFYTICSNVDDVFVIYSTSTRKYEYISPNFEKVLGISSKILIKDKYKLLEFIPVEYREKIVKTLLTARVTDLLEVDFEYIKPQANQRYWIMIRVYPVYKNNNIIRYIWSATDITKEKKYQKAIEEALTSVQKANEAKKVFLSHMSHELKTPINAIIGMAQIASMSLEDTEKVDNCLSRINTSSRNLLKLINNILDISKIDSDKLVLMHEMFDLSDIITPFSSLMNSQADLNNQIYVHIMNIQHNCLMGDSLRLIQILENCISNSIKFTPPGGKITFEVSEIEALINTALFRFIISDTGKGMCEEYLKRLYTPFEQEDHTILHRYGGTGLGMTIAKELVNLMGGKIQVDSKVGVGTTITIDIRLELSYSKSKPAQVGELHKIYPEPAEYDCNGKRVLLVEDNDINREITCEFLSIMKANVETAANGYEAINLFEASVAGYYDFILMDLQMPEMDGFETSTMIRSSSHPDAKTICIIAMTAGDFQDDLNLNCGMNYYITKPLEIDKLYSIMQKPHINSEVFSV